MGKMTARTQWLHQDYLKKECLMSLKYFKSCDIEN